MADQRDIIYLRLPPELKKQLEERAESDGRSLNNYLERLVRRELSKRSNHPIP